MKSKAAIIMASLLAGGGAVADVRVAFEESAPKDRFVIENTGACPTGAFEMTIDLTGSSAGLIFDTAGGGMGVEVFQPLELAAGGHLVRALAPLSDGDRALNVSLASLSPGDRVVLTVDVDDTLARSEWGQIRVSGAEIEGGSVIAGNAPAAFDRRSVAIVPMDACVS